MSDEGVGAGGGLRSRRTKAKVIDYAKEQEFSDGDLFEDQDKIAVVSTNAIPKRRRTKGTRKSKGSKQQQQQQQGDFHAGGMDPYNDDDAEEYHPPKPIYTEKGYDPTLPPIRERFPFLPEYELDGAPKIEGIVGRRPVDENEDKNIEEENSSDGDDGNLKEDDEESDGQQRRNRPRKKKDKKVSVKNKSKEYNSTFVDYEYLVKYKNQSYLHLEWKTGADLESMNKSAKTIYRRYVKKIAQGQDEELEDPNFDPTFVVVQKVLAEEEQDLELELSDKELLEWEKEREKEIADEDFSEEDEEEKKDKSEENGREEENNAHKKDETNASSPEEKKDDPVDWRKEDIDFSQFTIDQLKSIIDKEGPYYPKFEGCDNGYRDGYITEPPKKPRASYLIFQCAMRSYFAMRNPNATNAELMTILGEQWSSMSDNGQEPFLELAKEEHKQYEHERALMEKAQRPNEMWQSIRRCRMVVDRLAQDGFANIFLEPVNLEDFPDYEEATEQPMDLGTVRTKLESKKYQMPEQFARDMRKIWNNCKIYNRHGSAIWHVADYMSKQFERLYHAWVQEFRERYLRWAHPRARPWENTCREHDGKCNTKDKDLVLCDHCDAAYGYKCTTPPPDEIPRGIWHCPDCTKKLRSGRGVRMLSAMSEQAARKRAELGEIPKRKVKQTMYLVKWAGLGYEFCTWETKNDVGNSDVISEYLKLNDSFPDEVGMPEEAATKILSATEHINRKNAGGSNCIPDLRTSLYAQTRAFQFMKFGLDVPENVCRECGPVTKASHEIYARDEGSPTHLKEVLECVYEMTERVALQDTLPLMMKSNLMLSPLLTGEYDAVVPITSKGLMMNVGEINGSVAFLGYRQFKDGTKGPAELNQLIRGQGDKIIAVDGVSTIKKSFKEIIAMLRESGKNKFAIMRFLESKLTTVEGDYTSYGNRGRYSIVELKKKFSNDRKQLLVKRDMNVLEEETKEEEIIKEVNSSDEEADSEGEFQPDSEDEGEEGIGTMLIKSEETDFPMVESDEIEQSTSEEVKKTPTKTMPDGKIKIDTPATKNDTKVEKCPSLDDNYQSLTIQCEKTRSLASRLLNLDIGYSSDEGGDENCVFYIDGLDDTFTSELPPKNVKLALEGNRENIIPVKRNEFSSLGDRSKLLASVAITSFPPDIDDFDENFPFPSKKEIVAKEAEAKKAEDEALTPASPEKIVKKSTVKIEQISVETSEVLNVWANVESAAATLQLSVNEIKKIIRGDFDDDFSDEVGGFCWQYADSGALVTAGESKRKESKQGKEALMEFRDKLYDPLEPHTYKNNNRLRDYQVEGVNWLASTFYRKHGCVLADEMGLGKTVQIVSYLEHLFRIEKILGPFLVVVPLSTVEHWRREFEGWADMVCCVYHDRQRQWRDVLREYEWYYEDKPRNAEFLKFHVLVTTYDTLIGDFDVIGQIPFRVAVVDEAHRLRNQKGKLLECMKEISVKGTQQHGYQSRVLMTGTPLQNDLSELWTLLNFIEPFKFPDLDNFLHHFGNMRNREQVENLQRKISPFMLRRVKEDVAKDIPTKEETVIDVELTSIQKQYYRAIFERNHAFLNMGSSRVTAPKLMNIQMELRKVCNHPCLLDGVEHREQDSVFKEFLEAGKFDGKSPEEQQYIMNEHLQVQTSGKMVLLDKLLPKLRQEDHKVLLFSQMVKMLDLISEYCDFREFPHERLDGRVRGTDRQKSIDRFNQEEDAFLFLLSTRAGGVGINLTAADICIIFDSDWNPQNDVQAQARCHRIGQTKDVRIYRLVTSRSFEQEMFDRASKKLGLEQAVLGTFGQDEDDAKPTNKEMEQLLKKGAYALLEDDNDEVVKQFCADDIDSILAKRTRTRVVDSTKTASWLNKKGMVVSKSKFTSDTKSAGLDMNDPLFWQKVMPDFITPMLMVQQLEDLSNEIFGITKKKGPGRGRGRWKRKNKEDNSDKEPVDNAEEKSIEDDDSKDDVNVDSGSDTGNKTDDGDDEEKDNEKEKKFQLTKTQKRKLAKFMSDLKSMMEGLLDEAEDDSISSEQKASAQKLLLKISMKEKLFNADQRHFARATLKRLEGNRRRRCRTSDQGGRSTPNKLSRENDFFEIREELRIVSSKKIKKRRKKGGSEDEQQGNKRRKINTSETGEDGYKIHSDDEADWSDIGDDIYGQSSKKKSTISRKEARRRRQWAADGDAAVAAGRPWPALPRTEVSKVLKSLLEEVLKHDEAKGGIFSVSVPRDDFPEYYAQIETPMDYGTMKSRLDNGEYRSGQSMQKDFRLVMQNCLQFNAHESEICQEARQQALMRPNQLREAAIKNDLFLAEDGSVLYIVDEKNGKVSSTSSSTKKRRKRSRDDPKDDETTGVPPEKKKGRKGVKYGEAINLGVEEDDVPLTTMKKRKPRIKINLREAEDRRKSMQAEDEEEKTVTGENLDQGQTPATRKKRGRMSSAGTEKIKEGVCTKRIGKTRSTKQNTTDIDVSEGDVSTKRSGKTRSTKQSTTDIDVGEGDISKKRTGKTRSTKQSTTDIDVGEGDSNKAKRRAPASRGRSFDEEYLNVALLRTQRENLGSDPCFAATRKLFVSKGAWVLPSPLAPDKFRDVALLTLKQAEKIDRYSVFAEPVSDADAPDYSDVISNPIDLATMKAKLNNGDYGKGTEGASKIYADFLLMFDNCRLYNDDDGEVIEEAARVMALFPEIYGNSCSTIFKKQKTKTK